MNKSMDKVLKELKRPFHSSNVEFKIAARGKGDYALCVAYVDARHVQERLNNVCEGFWSNSFREVFEDGKLKAVEATILIRVWELDHWNEIAHADIGAPDNMNDDFSHGFKALYSDAFKRAGVHFGIAAPFYYCPKFYLKKEDKFLWMKDGIPKGVQKGGEEKLREDYKKYLVDEGVKKFGEPL